MYYRIYRDNQQQSRCTFYANNSRVIAVSSEAYVNKADCQRSIDLVKGSNNAPVYEA